MKKGIGFALFLLCIAGFGWYLYHKPHQNMYQIKADYQISANELFQAFDENERTANEQYLDKVIEVSGTIREFSKAGDLLSIHLESEHLIFGVIAQLDALSEHSKTDFRIGDSIRLKGICSGMLSDVVLVRCIVL